MQKENLLRTVNEALKERLGGKHHRSSNLKKYTSSNPLKQFLINRFLVNIVEAVRDIKATKVVEVGCGEGVLIKCLTLKTSFRIFGCDIHKEAVQFAQLINPDQGFFIADIEVLPIEDQACDIVFCCEVLEHLRIPSIALQEIKRITKKYCVISVPYEPYFCIMNFMSGKNVRTFGNDPEHIQKWTKNQFEAFLRKEFKIISLRTSLPWLIALCRIE